MQSGAATVSEYVKSLPPERRVAIEALRKVIRANMDPLLEEGMSYGMICYYIPHRHYPAGYHCNPEQPLPYAGLASQKNHMSYYTMAIYGDEKEVEWFKSEWKKTGKKMDMGKSCIRFKKLDDLPVELIAASLRRATVAKFIEQYERVIRPMNKQADAKARTSAPKPTRQKPPPGKKKPIAKSKKK
jgi:uncharacterized protein YdhG (YjbR/CyaY superfamily)